MLPKKLIERLTVKPGKRLRLRDHETALDAIPELDALGEDELKDRARIVLEENLTRLADAQALLYADNRYAVLVVLQGMDASGKDGTIKHVMAGVNPLGCEVTSFKQPSLEELEHTFLWRYQRAVPRRGNIGIFNRSHYEDVLIVRVHPELVEKQKVPDGKPDKAFWRQRYEDINTFERHLVENGTLVLKFFLHISKKEQKRRFIERLDDPKKHWKFNAGDIAERTYWKRYMRAYEDALSATSTKRAPWYVVPADRKWAARAIIADILTTTITRLDLRYPEVTGSARKALAAARAKLEKE